MSDGNFNRALLEHTPYRSGLQVGRQQMRSMVSEELGGILSAYPQLSAKERQQILEDLMKALRNR